MSYSKRTIFLEVAAAVGVASALIGCGKDAETTKPDREKEQTEMARIAITSTAFADGRPIPKRHTGDGDDVSPPLSWSNVPEGTKELALIVDDPDAPTPQPWVHWVLYKIPGDTTALPEATGASGRTATGMTEGENGWGRTGWGGPAPPEGHGVHHYHFKLYALDAELDLPAGASKADLLRAMTGHVLAEGELVGTYQR
jgi:hypothetical protein